MTTIAGLSDTQGPLVEEPLAEGALSLFSHTYTGVASMPRRGPVLILLVLLAGCTGVPEGVQPVTGFELERYLGTWYEIARLDHPFERGLSRVTAEYSRREDGGVRVVNRGYDAAAGRWNQIEGKAYFVEGPDLGRLKVSFFGPFYGGYNIFALDREDYGYAMISGPDKSYLWILARRPQLDPDTLGLLVEQARGLGFPVDELIQVSHPELAPASWDRGARIDLNQ